MATQPGVDQYGLIEQILPTSDTNSEGTLKYITPNGEKAFDIKGIDGSEIQTTYNNNGYTVTLATIENGQIVEEGGISVVNGQVTTKGDYQVQPLIEFTADGHYVRVTYRLFNTSSEPRAVCLAVDADIMIGNDDNAAITSTNTGFIMQNGKTEGVGAGKQFNVYCLNTYGATSVDGLWYGEYSDRKQPSNRWYNGLMKDPLTSTDSGMAISWQNRVLAPKTYQDFSFLLSVGEQVNPPQIDMDTELTLGYNATEASVEAKVTDAPDRTYQIFYSLDDAAEEIMAAHSPDHPLSTDPIQANGSQQTNTGTIPIPQDWEENSVHKLQIWVKNDKYAMSDVKTVYIRVVGADQPVVPAEERTVTFDANGGSGSMTSTTAYEGTQITLPLNGFASPANAEFVGWRVGSTEEATELRQPGESVTVPVGQDTIVYAIWHTHNWGTSAWAGDSTHHWHECSNADCPITDNSQKNGYEAHSLVEIPSKPATCEESGLTAGQKCETCGKITKQQEIIPASGHTWNTPTYTWTDNADGSKSCKAEHVCVKDTQHVETETVKASETTTPATCTQDGKTVYTATFTNNAFETQTKSVTIKHSGHTWGEWITDKPSSCTEKGSQHRECSVCRTTETKDIDINAHEWNTEYTTDKAATCTEDGSKSIHCKNCDTKKDSETIPALGHKWAIDNAGWQWGDDLSSVALNFVCQNDSNHEEPGTVTVSHKTTTQPTCTTPGVETYTAKATNPSGKTTDADGNEYIDTKTKEIAATGHSFGAWTPSSDEKNHTRTCVCGAVETEAHSWNDWVASEDGQHHESTCKVCGVSESVAHEWNTGTITKEPTYEAEGERTYTCATCGTMKTEAVAKLVAPAESSSDSSNRTPGTADANGLSGIAAVSLAACAGALLVFVSRKMRRTK